MKRKRLLSTTILSLLAGCLVGCGENKILNPNNPAELTVWHYYNGAQQAAFNSQLALFNSTKGKELGIHVEGISKGSVSELEKALSDSANEEVGAEKLPSIFSGYPDTASAVEKKGLLVDLTKYFSSKELSQYVQGYLDEGRFGKDNGLYLLPVAKSTEVFAMNKTEWDVFASATGASLNELETVEGVVRVAQRYYEWSDSLTPDVANDGKAFYGRDSMSNYFILGMKQMGIEMLGEKDEKLNLNADKASIRRLWDNYYVPTVKGYFAALGRFRSDDVKTGDILAYTGSSSSISYFPSKVDNGEDTHDIDHLILSAPIMEDGKRIHVQQGAGMTITKSDQKTEYASSVFLKWFTEPRHNINFSIGSSYLPVRNDSNNMEAINQVIEEDNISVSKKTKDCLEVIMGSFKDTEYFAPKNFDNAYRVRSILDYSLSDLAKADREAVVSAIEGGATKDEALANYLTDDKFESWYSDFVSAIEAEAAK